ncbi:MAG TPA: cytidylate kinase-like family protein [Alphaproteobacteria bacterium]|nr:cytidylate kinase-like family protein [Alphaproteobacteria bacterium]
MWKNINLEKCIARINDLKHEDTEGAPAMRPSVTISRMAGAGGRTVASKLADYLQPYAPYGRQWTIFDRNLIAQVLEDGHLSRQLADCYPEASQPLLRELLLKLGRSNPSVSTVVKQSVETIWKLAKGGYVILVGRAANVITAGQENVFHVRLEGSREKRIARLETVYDFDLQTAVEYLKSQDAAKKLYLADYFGRDIDDPLLYDMIVNTDEISFEQVAMLIALAVIRRFDLEAQAKAAWA